MKKVLLFVVLVVVLLSVAGTAFAHGRYYGSCCGPRYGYGYPRVVYAPPVYVYPTPVPYYVPRYIPRPVYPYYGPYCY